MPYAGSGRLTMEEQGRVEENEPSASPCREDDLVQELLARFNAGDFGAREELLDRKSVV